MSKTVVNKVTKVVWDNGFKPDGVNIPSVTSADQGKVLAVDSNGKWVAASPSAPQSELPEYSAADEGKILKVDDQGALEWAEDDNTEYTAGDNVSIDNGVISATDTTYTAGDNIEISADNEISSVNTIVFNAKYLRATDTFQYDDTAIAPFLAEVFKNDKRAIVRVQDGNYDIYDIYTLYHYEEYNNFATFTKTHPIIVSANQREIVCSHIGLAVSNGTGTLTYTNEGVTDLPEGATAGQIPISDGHNGWVAGTIPTELPSVSSADEGKVLKVDGNGDWAVGTDNDTTYTAGTNVQINGNVISATDTTYTAGTNVSISAGNVISATDTTYTAGANVQINDGVISATDTTYTAGTNVQITNGVISATDTTYTAGNGITITGTSIAADDQLPSVTSADEGKILTVDSNGDWVKGDNDAGIVKAAIAEDYAGADGTLPFYPIFSNAIASSGNMTRDCLAGQNSGWAGTAGARPYSTTRNDIYMAIYKKDGNYGIALFTTGNSVTGDGSVKIQYINQDGTIQSDETSPYITSAFTGTVNSGYGTGTSTYCLYHSNYSLISADLITCAKDLSLCVYNSYQDAEDAFGAWQIPGVYSEGDQVWKDGKLQTYTSGNWVDSDPIVEQIANASGGITLLANNTSASSQTKAWGANSPVPVVMDLTNVDLTGYEKFLVTIDGTGNSPGGGSTYITNTANQYLIEGRYINNEYTFEQYFIGKLSNGHTTSPSYNVYMRIDIQMTSTYLHLWVYSDKTGTSSQTEQQPYLFTLDKLDVKLYGVK